MSLLSWLGLRKTEEEWKEMTNEEKLQEIKAHPTTYISYDLSSLTGKKWEQVITACPTYMRVCDWGTMSGKQLVRAIRSNLDVAWQCPTALFERLLVKGDFEVVGYIPFERRHLHINWLYVLDLNHAAAEFCPRSGLSKSRWVKLLHKHPESELLKEYCPYKDLTNGGDNA